MAEPDQPKKETVRINLPVPPPMKPPEPSVKPRETVRIQLPTRETGGPPSPSSPQSAPEDLSSTNFFPQPKPPADLGGATVTPSPDFTSNNPTLAEQRAPFAEIIRNDPAKALQLAARLYSEDQNNADSRVGILEAMLNRLNATGQDPFNPKYYPKDPTQYNAAYEKLSKDNALLDQVYQEMERAWGGSNISNYATDWASDEPGNPVATNALKYSTGTWLAPTGEQFYRKDLFTLDPATGQPHSGAANVNRNLQWYDSVRDMNQPAYPNFGGVYYDNSVGNSTGGG